MPLGTCRYCEKSWNLSNDSIVQDGRVTTSRRQELFDSCPTRQGKNRYGMITAPCDLCSFLNLPVGMRFWHRLRSWRKKLTPFEHSGVRKSRSICSCCPMSERRQLPNHSRWAYHPRAAFSSSCPMSSRQSLGMFFALRNCRRSGNSNAEPSGCNNVS